MFEWFNPLYLKDKANGFKTDEYVKVSELHCYVLLDLSRGPLSAEFWALLLQQATFS